MLALTVHVFSSLSSIHSGLDANATGIRESNNDVENLITDRHIALSEPHQTFLLLHFLSSKMAIFSLGGAFSFELKSIIFTVLAIALSSWKLFSNLVPRVKLSTGGISYEREQYRVIAYYLLRVVLHIGIFWTNDTIKNRTDTISFIPAEGISTVLFR